MDRLSYWLNSCSFDESVFSIADELCQKNIAPFFKSTQFDSLEQFITTTLKLYKEVEFIRNSILGDRLNLNYISRKEFAENVMSRWQQQHPGYASIVAAICYDLNLHAVVQANVCDLNK